MSAETEREKLGRVAYGAWHLVTYEHPAGDFWRCATDKGKESWIAAAQAVADAVRSEASEFERQVMCRTPDEATMHAALGAHESFAQRSGQKSMERARADEKAQRDADIEAAVKARLEAARKLAVVSQLKSTGHTPYLERMSALAQRAEAAERELARIKADVPRDEIETEIGSLAEKCVESVRSNLHYSRVGKHIDNVSAIIGDKLWADAEAIAILRKRAETAELELARLKAASKGAAP